MARLSTAVGALSESPHLAEVVGRTFLLVALGFVFPLVQAAQRSSFIYGSDLGASYEWPKHLYRCDKGAAFTAGSLDDPFKTWHRAGPGGLRARHFDLPRPEPHVSCWFVREIESWHNSADC